jgi:hypothetical protein
VLVEEKVDGSQFSFGRFGGELRVRSKGRQFDPDAADKLFASAVAHVAQLDLRDGYTYRGEVLSKPKHNVLAYGRVPAGNVIIKQGDPGDAFYMISTGKVEVWDKEKKLTDRKPGEYFGESALVNDHPRAATVKAVAATELYVLYKEDFKKILMANPGIAESIRLHIAKLKY